MKERNPDENLDFFFSSYFCTMTNEDKKQRDELVSKNMGYVVTLARQYSSELLSTDDLISEGSIGMIKAAEKYDPSRGKPFVTFAAPYIRHSIEDAIRKVTGEVPVLSTDESLPVGSKNNYTLLNVLRQGRSQG